MFGSTERVDGRPTMAEWPVSVRALSEVPAPFLPQVEEWTGAHFQELTMLYAPVRRTVRGSFTYFAGYGQEELLVLKMSQGQVQRFCIPRSQILRVTVEKELLNAAVTLHYRLSEEERELRLPYTTAVYYLYDPMVNWLLHMPADFLPSAAEKQSPRPRELRQKSLTMYNYATEAYRLGERFGLWKYEGKLRSVKWYAREKALEETLEVSMERGIYRVRHFQHLSQTDYEPTPSIIRRQY